MEDSAACVSAVNLLVSACRRLIAGFSSAGSLRGNSSRSEAGPAAGISALVSIAAAPDAFFSSEIFLVAGGVAAAVDADPSTLLGTGFAGSAGGGLLVVGAGSAPSALLI